MKPYEYALIIVAAVILLVILLRIFFRRRGFCGKWLLKKEEPAVPAEQQDSGPDAVERGSSSSGTRWNEPRTLDRGNVGESTNTWSRPSYPAYFDRSILHVENESDRRLDVPPDTQPRMQKWDNRGENTNTWSRPSYPAYFDRSIFHVETESARRLDVAPVPNPALIAQKSGPGAPRQPLASLNVLDLDSEQWPTLPQPVEVRPSRPRTRSVVVREQEENTTAKKKRKRRGGRSVPVYGKKQMWTPEGDLNQQIEILQSSLSRDNTPDENSTIVSQVQELLISTSEHTQDSDNCPLIIGVDATPAAQAGYLVNQKEKSLSYYVIHRNDLPWTLHDAKDPSEFEMKNFMFALTLWQDDILRWKRMRIYTDNFAITKQKCFDDNKYGERAAIVLEHFQICKRVDVLNEDNIAVNRFKNLKHFAKYIQPADDLSRWQIDEAIKFLTTIYGIDQENVEGTHVLSFRKKTDKPFYKTNARYKKLLDKAKNNIDFHECPNKFCSGTSMLQASLRYSNR